YAGVDTVEFSPAARAGVGTGEMDREAAPSPSPDPGKDQPDKKADAKHRRKKPPAHSRRSIVQQSCPVPPFLILIYVGCSAGDIARQIVVMECLGIQTFPCLRRCLKDLTSQYDTCLTSSGV